MFVTATNNRNALYYMHTTLVRYLCFFFMKGNSGIWLKPKWPEKIHFKEKRFSMSKKMMSILAGTFLLVAGVAGAYWYFLQNPDAEVQYFEL